MGRWSTVEGEVVNSGAKPAENVKLTVSAMDNNGKTVGTQPATVPAVGAGQRVPFSATMKRPRNATQFSANIDGGPQGFRDLSFIDLPEATQGQVRISRAFAVAAGELRCIRRASRTTGQGSEDCAEDCDAHRKRLCSGSRREADDEQHLHCGQDRVAVGPVESRSTAQAAVHVGDDGHCAVGREFRWQRPESCR